MGHVHIRGECELILRIAVVKKGLKKRTELYVFYRNGSGAQCCGSYEHAQCYSGIQAMLACACMLTHKEKLPVLVSRVL